MFLAKQGMELIQLIGPYAPFEKFDLACFLYERIMNKNSFQLILNLFEDEQEKDNIVHRLGLHKQNNLNNIRVVTNNSTTPATTTTAVESAIDCFPGLPESS